MAFGLTDDGLVIKRFSDIKSEIEIVLRDTFGNGINLLPTELVGQFVSIISEREALIWEKLQDVYDSFSPANSSGVSLDNAVSITGIQRLEATKGTGTVTAYGTLSTVIAAGSIVSVDGNADARFVTLEDATIGAGTNEVQDIDFDAVPDSGSWTLVFDGDETSSLNYNANASTIQSALNSLSGLSDVTVLGDYSSGFTVTFAGADGSVDQPMLQIGTNTLESSSVEVSVSFTETVKGILPNVDINIEAESAGLIPAYAGTLTVIETPIAGWDSVSNDSDITAGTNVETDAELRLRRLQTLATPGTTTPDAIRAKILAIDEVDACKVFENTNNFVDAQGRPPHSFEAVVLGGDNQEIVNTIWSNKPIGISPYGSSSGTAVDNAGTNHTVYFSRPTEIDIYVIVNLTINSDYPSGGDDAVKEAIVEYALNNFGIGDDVITVRFFTPLNEIDGVTDIEILIGTSISPTTDNNILIAENEISNFDTANITVNS